MPDSRIYLPTGEPVDTATQANGDHRQAFVLGDATSAQTVIVDTAGRALVALDGQSGVYPEDSAHVSGDRGQLMLGVRNPTFTALAGTDGDYSPLATSPNGSMLTAHLSGSNAFDGAGGMIALNGAGQVSVPAVSPYLYNGSTFDRERANIDGTALALAARTAITQSAFLTNYNGRGVLVTLNVTAVGATGGLVLRIRAVDPASGATYVLNVAPPAVTVTGVTSYLLYPGASGGAVNQVTSLALPRIWYVLVAPNDASSYEYSVGYSIIR